MQSESHVNHLFQQIKLKSLTQLFHSPLKNHVYVFEESRHMHAPMSWVTLPHRAAVAGAELSHSWQLGFQSRSSQQVAGP